MLNDEKWLEMRTLLTVWMLLRRHFSKWKNNAQHLKRLLLLKLQIQFCVSTSCDHKNDSLYCWWVHSFNRTKISPSKNKQWPNSERQFSHKWCQWTSWKVCKGLCPGKQNSKKRAVTRTFLHTHLHKAKLAVKNIIFVCQRTIATVKQFHLFVFNTSIKM